MNKIKFKCRNTFCLAWRKCQIFSFENFEYCKYKNLVHWIENVHRTYYPDHLVVQSWSIASTTNKLPLACRTYPNFVVTDITFLATHLIAFFHKFASVIAEERKTHPLSFSGEILQQLDYLLFLFLCDYLDSGCSFCRYRKTTFFTSGLFQIVIWDNATSQTHKRVLLQYVSY
jgi:hypothetical protein